MPLVNCIAQIQFEFKAAVREPVGGNQRGDCNGIVAGGGGPSIDPSKGWAECIAHDGPLNQTWPNRA